MDKLKSEIDLSTELKVGEDNLQTAKKMYEEDSTMYTMRDYIEACQELELLYEKVENRKGSDELKRERLLITELYKQEMHRTYY